MVDSSLSTVKSSNIKVVGCKVVDNLWTSLPDEDDLVDSNVCVDA